MDLCRRALGFAVDVASALGHARPPRFVHADLFDLAAGPLADAAPFDIVNSLGVLHHTADCRAALDVGLAGRGRLHLPQHERHGVCPGVRLARRLRARTRTRQGVAPTQRVEGRYYPGFFVIVARRQ